MPEQGQSLTAIKTDKKVSDLIDADVQISADGKVTGTVKKVENFTDFSKEETEGYYFPLTLGEKFSGKEITCKGMEVPETKSHDLDWILKLSNGKESKFTFSAEDAPTLELTFKDVILAE